MPRVELQGDLLALADGGRRVDPEDEQGLAHADLPLEGIAHEDQGLDRSAKDILPSAAALRKHADELGADADGGRLPRRRFLL